VKVDELVSKPLFQFVCGHKTK